MTRFFPILFIILTCFWYVDASAQSDLKSLLDQITSEIGAVSSKKYNYQQSWSYNSSQPTAIEFRIEQSDSKGNIEQESFEFNLADLDDRNVSYQSQKDVILVELQIKGRQKFIKTFEDGTLQNYSSEVQILAKDIENARKIQQLIKEAIPLARETIKNRLQLNSFEEMIQWLEKNVKGGSIEEETYRYEWTQDDALDTKCKLTFDLSDSKSSEQIIYDFNLYDFKNNAVQMKIKGKTPYVELKTANNLKYIAVTTDGVPDNYGNTLEIYTDEVEKARDIETVLNLLIPLCEERMKTQLPSFPSGDQAMEFLNSAITTVSLGEDTYSQTWKGDCRVNFELMEEDGKSDPEINNYAVNLGDLDENKVEIEVSGETVSLSLQTKNKVRYIKEVENGELQNYSDEVEIVTAGIEPARFLAEAFKSAIKTCQERLGESVPTETPDAAFSWFQSRLQSIQNGDDTKNQTIEKMEGTTCKWSYTIEVIGSKGSENRVHEFALKDLDEKSLALDVSGKELYVEVHTNGREKILKTFENGEVEPYEEELKWQYEDLEAARSSITALKALIEGCKQ